MADIRHDDERRVMLGGRQVAHVELGLPLRLVHGRVPTRRAPDGRPPAHPPVWRQRERLVGLDSIAALLGLEHEAIALAEVDPLDRRRSVRVREWDGALEDVGILLVVRTGGIRPGDVEEITQLVQEHRVVGTLRGARGFPAPEEPVNRTRGDSQVSHLSQPRRSALT